MRLANVAPPQRVKKRASCGAIPLALACFLLVLFAARITYAVNLSQSNDFQRLAELNTLAARSTSANPAKALEYAGEALKIAVTLKNPEAQSIALLNIDWPLAAGNLIR